MSDWSGPDWSGRSFVNRFFVGLVVFQIGIVFEIVVIIIAILGDDFSSIRHRHARTTFFFSQFFGIIHGVDHGYLLVREGRPGCDSPAARLKDVSCSQVSVLRHIGVGHATVGDCGLHTYVRAMRGTTLTDRAIIRLAGDGIRDFLQGLVTNDVKGDLPVWAGLLTPQGKALFDFIVWADGDDVLIDGEAAQAEALARRLKIYRLRLPITIEIDASIAVHWATDGEVGVPDPRDARLGHRWIAPPGEAASGWHAHRLSLGVVEGVAELGSDATLWLEANAREQNGVSFTKGCYVGQENTARMNYRQKVNRRLAVVEAEVEPEGARAYYPAFRLAVVRERIT
jgi:folate-binding protein YgfZ